MSHDANQVLMGNVGSSAKEITSKVGAYAAGLVVCLKSDDTVSITKSDGARLGVSAGKDLSDTNKMAIVRKGLRVPVLLTAAFSPAIGAQVAIFDTTGKACTYSGSGDAYVNAVYVSEKLDAILEDGTIVTDGVALIDFPGGL
jgi:hypothetical protein